MKNIEPARCLKRNEEPNDPKIQERKTQRATNLPAVKKQYLFSKPEQTRFKFLNFLIKMISRKYKKFKPQTCSGPVFPPLVTLVTFCILLVSVVYQIPVLCHLS